MTDELTNTVELGRRFVDALVAHDWDSVAGCFAPDARFLAVIANETSPFREKLGGAAAAEQIARWFGDADVTELMDSAVEPLVDRVKIMYRVHEHEPDGWYVVEQLAYVTPGDGGFARMNLACSGFRPVPE
jgi:hypothetical protein